MKSQVIGIRRYSREDKSGNKTFYYSIGLATFDPLYDGGAKGETINVPERNLDGYVPANGDIVAVQRGEPRNYNGNVFCPIEGVILLNHDK